MTGGRNLAYALSDDGSPSNPILWRLCNCDRLGPMEFDRF